MAKTIPVFEIDESQIKFFSGSFKDNKFFIQEYFLIPSNIDFFSSSHPKVFNDQVRRVEEIIKKISLKEKRIHVVIPDSVTYSAFLVFPRLQEKELYSAIKFQADQIIPLNLNEASLDIDILEENKEKDKLLVLVVATEKKNVEKITELFETVGLIPEVIEPQLSAVGKFFSYVNLENMDNSLLINFDYFSTTVYFYEKKRRLIFQSHTFKNGYNLLVKELALGSDIDINKASLILKSVGLSEDKGSAVLNLIHPALEDFVNEIKQAINIATVRHGLNLQKLYFLNLSDYVKDFDLWLTRELNLPVENLNLTSAINFSSPISLEILRAISTGIGSLI